MILKTILEEKAERKRATGRQRYRLVDNIKKKSVPDLAHSRALSKVRIEQVGGLLQNLPWGEDIE